MSVGFTIRPDLPDISVLEADVRSSCVVVRERGVEGRKPLALCVSCYRIGLGEKHGTRPEIGAGFKELFDRKLQTLGMFAIHLQKPDANGDLL